MNFQKISYRCLPFPKTIWFFQFQNGQFVFQIQSINQSLLMSKKSSGILNCNWRISRSEPIKKNSSKNKVSRINEKITEIKSDIDSSTVILFLNNNPFTTLKGLDTLQNLKELYLDSTNLSSLKYANDQPSLEVISFFNTPFNDLPLARVMCGLAFHQSLKEVNKIEFTEKEKEFCKEHGKELRIELYEGLILTATNPIRWINPETKKKIEFYPNKNPIKRYYSDINHKYPKKKSNRIISQKPKKNQYGNESSTQNDTNERQSRNFIQNQVTEPNQSVSNHNDSFDIYEKEQNQEVEQTIVNYSKFAQFSSDNEEEDNFDFQNIPQFNKTNTVDNSDDEIISKSNNENTSTAAALAVNSLAAQLGMNIINGSDSDSEMQTDYFNKMANYNKNFMKSLETSSAYSSVANESNKSKDSHRKRRKAQQNNSSDNTNLLDNTGNSQNQQNIQQQQNQNIKGDDSYTVDYTDYNTSTISVKKQQSKQEQPEVKNKKSSNAKHSQDHPQQKSPVTKEGGYSEDNYYSGYSSVKPSTKQPTQQQPSKPSATKEEEYSEGGYYSEYSSAKPPQKQPAQQQPQKQPPQNQSNIKPNGSPDEEYYSDYSSVKPPQKQPTQQQPQPSNTKNNGSQDEEYYSDYSSVKPPQKQPAQQQPLKPSATKEEEYSEGDYYSEYSNVKPPQKQPAQQHATNNDADNSDYYEEYTSSAAK